jgi:hypothetical protein
MVVADKKFGVVSVSYPSASNVLKIATCYSVFI